jgi:integrase/recombinase XerD
MRYTGLRISDAVTLHQDRIKDDVLELRTAKSGMKVRVPLNPAVVEALKGVTTKGGYYFWSGEGKPRSCVGDWQRTLLKMFARAGVEGFAHRFRHTFAVELLQKGVSMEDVSVLLGHRSIRVTERHYASWAAGRQSHLEDEVRRTW